jgi:trehalose 6-phosphate synthase/phosphatase
MLISYGDFVYSFFYFLFEEESSKMLCQYVYVSALQLYLMFVTTWQGVNKGLVAERLLEIMKQKGMLPDFVLCIGDDRSDEDMFEVIMSARSGPSLSPVAEVFACTVGRKPSKAKYYLEDTSEILRMLQGLASASEQVARSAPQSSQQVIIDRE